MRKCEKLCFKYAKRNFHSFLARRGRGGSRRCGLKFFLCTVLTLPTNLIFFAEQTFIVLFRCVVVGVWNVFKHSCLAEPFKEKKNLKLSCHKLLTRAVIVLWSIFEELRLFAENKVSSLKMQCNAANGT